MDNAIIRKTFRYAGMAGLLLIITNAFLFLILPMKSGPMPDGFRMPLVAFEFLKTESETEIMFYDSGTEERGKLINAMDTANKVDFFFMACYTTFLVLYAAALFMESRNKIYYAGIFLALLVCVADLMENLQMLSITSKLGYGGYSHELWRLNQYTWMKWGCLSVNMLLLSWQQFRNSGFYFSLSAIATAASLTGVIAFIHRGIFNEIFLGLLAVCFALMIASCFFQKARTSNPSLMKNAFYGFYSLVILGFHGSLILLESMGVFPYFRTPLYPVALLFSFLIAMLGFFERDRFRIPSLMGMLISLGLMIHWIIALIQRLS